MTQQGATLQNYNSELVGCIEEVWTRQASPRRKPARARLDLFYAARFSVRCASAAWQLREKREELNKSIAQDEEEKGGLPIRPTAPRLSLSACVRA